MTSGVAFDKIDLSLIRAFHTVITERSVSRAALRLATSQPAVSGQLKRLRGLIGDPLLVRSVESLKDRADEIVVLADSSKFSIKARHVALPLSRISTLITDDGISGEDAEMLRAAGIKIVIASLGN